MKYRLAIFDMDGTILDTLEDISSGINHALEANGFPAKSVEEIRPYVGTGLRQLATDLAGSDAAKEDIDKVVDEFNRYYAVHCKDSSAPYDGIMDVIRHAEEKGLKTAVVSNKPDYGVQSLCDEHFAGLFDFVIGEKEGIRRKPCPDTVNEVLKRLDVKKEDAVYIGDTEVDIKTAENAGMDCIAVCWGFRTRVELEKSGGKVFAESPEDLKILL